jgi:hypothetical protein
MASTTFKTLTSTPTTPGALALFGNLARRLARFVERQNALAADRRARAELVALANQYEALQPGVAAELRAAATRH